MKREIKFRAFDKTTGRIKGMWNVLQITFSTLNGRKQEAELNNGRITIWTALEEIEIMQYAGLKDKNGKEIYEGDIVRTNYGKIGEVVFHVERSSYIIHDPDHFNEKLCDSPVEVIGNIYENPELLTDKQ